MAVTCAVHAPAPRSAAKLSLLGNSAFRTCDSCAFFAIGNLDSLHRVLKFCISVEVSMDVIVSFSVAVVRSSGFIVDRTE